MKTKKRSSFGSFIRGVIFTIIALLVIATCSSCDSEPSMEVGGLFDMSMSEVNLNRDNAQKIHQHLIRNVFHLEGESDFSGGIKFYLVIMGESARPRIRLVYLEPGKAKIITTKKHRVAQVQAFKDELLKALEEMISGELNQNSSYLHHAICYLGKVITESKFSNHKSIYCFSDGLENSHLQSFSEYHDDLEGFEARFSAISDQMNSDCQLPDMTGIEFNMFNSPNGPMGPIVLSSARYWQYHLEQAGATFRIRPNLSF